MTNLFQPALLAMAVLTAQEPQTFDLEQLHPRVHAAVVVPNPPHYAFANSLIVVGDSAVLVVDTQQSPGAARALIRALPAVTDRPVRWIVNTHWHADHVFGNAAWREAFPDVRIVGHRSLRSDVPERAAAYRDEQIEALPRAIRERETWLAEGRVNGEPLDAAARAAVGRSLDIRRRYLAELSGLPIVPPDIVMDDTLTIDLGGVTARLTHVGPAHTGGDLVVYVPDARILAMGDLVEWGTPWLEGACVGGWAAALDRTTAMGADRILPSHGPVVGPEFLALYRDLLAALASRGPLQPFRDRFAAAGVGVGGAAGGGAAGGSSSAFDRLVASVPSVTAAAERAGACAPS